MGSHTLCSKILNFAHADMLNGQHVFTTILHAISNLHIRVKLFFRKT